MTMEEAIAFAFYNDHSAQLEVTPPPQTPELPPLALAGLTKREVEVLRLVTQGLTDA